MRDVQYIANEVIPFQWKSHSASELNISGFHICLIADGELCDPSVVPTLCVILYHRIGFQQAGMLMHNISEMVELNQSPLRRAENWGECVKLINQAIVSYANTFQ